MTSPFSTTEAFNNAIAGPTKGAIYTFAHHPTLNYVALLIAGGLFIWFMTKLFSCPTRTSNRFDKSLAHLSNVVVGGLLSFVMAGKRQPSRHEVPPVQGAIDEGL